MATDLGNAVNARYVGPAGQQLFDGTILEPGMIVSGIGYDEATHSPYWEVVTKLAKTDEVQTDASVVRDDPSFGTEEGGEGTGRPALEDGDKPALPAPSPSPQIPEVTA